MKKYLIAFASVALLAGSLTSCKEKLKNMDGVVTQVETSNLGDTVKSMRLYNGEDTLIFNLMEAEYNNGLMMKGDSVQVHYVKGHGDTLRALLVFVKPTPAKVIDVSKDTTKVLLTK